jgi:hypothetical protein
MADTSERPTNVTAAPLPAADLPPADRPGDEPYRPLSLLALAGFALAAVYAFLVVLGGLVPVATQYPRLCALLAVAAPLVGAQAGLLSRKRSAARVAGAAGAGLLALLVVLGVGGLLAYSGTNPWLFLSGAGWFVVAAAALVCWMARSRIAASEGTLGGAGLANWGLALSLVSGLIYAAYLSSNTFAVRGQAREVAEEFIKLIADKNDPDSLLKAFQLTLPAQSRQTADLRRVIEVQHNVTQDPSGRMPGAFSQFRNSQYVRLIRMGADKVSFERVNMSEYERGAYRVGLIYRVEGPYGAVFVQVGTQGTEVTDETGTRRRWQVMTEGCKADEYRPNELAKQLDAGSRVAHDVVNAWMEQVRQGDTLTGYLFSLSEAERARQFGAAALTTPALPAVAGVALPGALAATSETREGLAKGQADYRAGKLIDTKTEAFFAAPDNPRAKNPTQHYDQMLAEVKTLFSGERPNLEFVQAGQPPAIAVADGRTTYLFPVRITTRAKGPEHPSYMIESEVEVVAPPAGKSGSRDYRIRSLRLIRGQVTPQNQRPGGPQFGG